MKYAIVYTIFIFSLLSCQPPSEPPVYTWEVYKESALLDSLADHDNPRMRFKMMQSKVLDYEALWWTITNQLDNFEEADYQQLKPIILEKGMTHLQGEIASGNLSYETLTKWYLYRIRKLEFDSATTLHTIIAINPKAVEMARACDAVMKENPHPIFGMPILLKDNINTEGLPTTAGAAAWTDNQASDAFIVERLKDQGAIILGKANLSEWAYFLTRGAPLGYSAVGGQTLNPYGRMIHETGGSSSGSGVAIAANYAVGAVGTETSGSILSPSGKNSIVGLKPTIGLLSRDGIVPISEMLDTPGPMTRSVEDNAILLSAMAGFDIKDPAMKMEMQDIALKGQVDAVELEGVTFGLFEYFKEDALYMQAVSKLVSMGADTVVLTMPPFNFDGFLTLLTAEIKGALPKYIQDYAGDALTHRSLDAIVAFNKTDTSKYIPYGQSLLVDASNLDMTPDSLNALKDRFHADGKAWFEGLFGTHNLHAILSVDNTNAGHAAMAMYPCLGVPMGYASDGEPTNLTIIGKPFSESFLHQVGKAFETATNHRKIPPGYE